MPQTLTEIVTGMEPLLIERLSRIRITWDGDGATATFAFSLHVPAGRSYRLGRYEVEVDTDDLPEGVTLTGFVCYPDLVRSLSLAPDVETQIRELSASGIVGTLDASRYEVGPEGVRQGHPAVSWVISTHAGSDAERQAWVRSTQPGRGGKREGSGRKPISGERGIPVSVWLSREDRDWIAQYGGGNASAGVRRLIAEARGE